MRVTLKQNFIFLQPKLKSFWEKWPPVGVFGSEWESQSVTSIPHTEVSLGLPGALDGGPWRLSWVCFISGWGLGPQKQSLR